MRSRVLGFVGALLVASALGVPAAAVDQTPDPTRDPTPAASESPDPSPDPSPGPSPDPSPDPTPQDDPSDTDPFIVVAESGTSAQEIKARAVALGVPVETLLEGVIEGLAVDLTPEQRAELSVEPGVDYIERDAPVSVFSSAIRTDAGCTTTSMGNIDDASSGSVSLGFSVNWYGTAYDSIIINNNGGMTFDDGLGDFRSYTGMNLDTTLRPLVLPLFTDLDTRNSSPVTYGPITVDGKSAYCINWVNVGEYASSAARHSFQLVVINQGSGNVDLEFNYGQVSTPQSSSNPTFVIGYADPQDRNNSLVRVRNTDSPAPYIDGGSSALVSNRFPENAAQTGRYTYEIRPTVPLPTPPTPPSLPTPGAANCTPSAQTPATWGLDRIDQRSLPIDNSYTCAGDGNGVRAYIVDTGIYANTDFSARLISGVSYVPGESSTVDCNGHGTHVAGTVGGTKYGVAKNVTLIPVRVLDCSGSGYTSSVVSGLNWIANQYDQPSDALYGSPAVVNMSLGGGVSKSTNDAVAALVATGVTVVVAAGNSNADASGFSPASEPTAITVGSTTSTDARSSFSNYGSLVDIFAPGSSIVSAWITSSTSTATLSGTSMASPHVAGAAAVYLGLNSNATPAQVDTALKNAATTNVVGNPGSGSPNSLLYARSFAVAPRLDSISPVSGSTTGGTTITVSGTNFTGTTGVTVGATAATGVTVVSDTSLTFVTPAGSAGAAAIAVTNSSGTTTLNNAFTYTNGLCAAPSLTSLSTSRGAADGTSSLTLTGSGFTGASAVTFGGRPATFTVVSDTSMTVTAPMHPVSDVNVVVSTACGSSTEVTPFAYLSPPTISYTSVDGGSTAGGNTVVIYGAEFTTDSAVAFGGNSAASITYVGSTQLQVITPAGTGTVDISVTTPGGTASATSAYSYYAAPTLDSLSASTGPATGSTGVRVFGTNLESTQSVTFGGSVATFFIFGSTEVYVFTPARAAGTVDVVLTTLGGSATLAGAFTYTAVAAGGGSSGGGSSSGSSESSGGGTVADDEITPTEDPVTDNQVSRPGQFQIVDSAGTPLQLRAAELTSQGFAIAGADWEIAGQGPINSASQNVAPGQRMTITGSGLQRLTTTGIYILSEPVWVGAGIVGYDGTFTATFTIPQLTSGNHTLQINMVRQGQLPVSVALGMNLTSAGAGPSKAPLSDTNLDTSAQTAAQLVSFAKGSAKLSTSAQAKLRKFATSALAASSTVAVIGFSSRGTVTTTPALAQRRAEAVSEFLTAQGVSSTPAVTQGESSVQGRSVLLVARPPSIGASQSTTTVSSLIVQYKKGVTPRSKVPITGTERVTGVRRSTLTLGSYLGFRMYQVNFATPVAVSLAEKVAAQMSRSRNVVFAEPDSVVSISTSTN